MIGIIGGTGIYQLDGLEINSEQDFDTPFGSPSSTLKIGLLSGREIAFLPRHGEHHQFLPSEVNYRANIFAMKLAGVTEIIGISAVGSLRKEIKSGEFSVPDQYFDWTKGNRKATFFGNGLVAHVSMARPACPRLIAAIVQAGAANGETIHTGKVYAAVEGPRLGSQAESHFLRGAGCDLVGMTNVPEAFLAREAQICYATIAIATDYDCWLNDPDQHVTVAMVIEWYGVSLGRVQNLLTTILANNLPAVEHHCRTSLDEALLTPEDGLEAGNRKLLEVLKR
ncbi:MAG: S-methyl-5'-thioadenosine phosphorylase [Candidatus Marinimicrobia bacterium]|nr:S-methyl-5'-thioadenosine phosphorylase [Candidatus Neomarinimicrobiota bacterium]